MGTVALWRMARDQQGRHGNITYPRAWETEYADPDGASWLFAQLDGRAESYLQYASEYFERQLAAEAVTAVLEHPPPPPAPLPVLNPQRSPPDPTTAPNPTPTPPHHTPQPQTPLPPHSPPPPP